MTKRRAKALITAVTFAALAFTVFTLRHQLSDTFANLRDARIGFIVLLVPLAFSNHYFQAKLYQGIFRILGDRFKTKSMFRLSLELNFVNNVFPSAGVSGFSYLSMRMRGEGVKAGRSTLVQVMRFAMLFISFQFLLGLGLLLLALSGKVSNFVMLACGSLATLLLVGTILVTYVIGSKNRINSFFGWLTKQLNKIIHVIRPRHPETINIIKVQEVFTELHESYVLIRSHRSQLKHPLIFATLANLAEVSAIYSVFIAYGHIINPGALIIAYAVANFAGIVSVLPGGIGIYEGLMTGVFAATGVPAGVSLPIILTFRLVSMSIQLLPGYYLYQRYISREDH